ncbi:hypothetical protein D3C72_2391660 [compost metagenome]
MLALANNVENGLPVVHAQVDAGRVVAAGVQHHDRTGGQVVQVFEQAATVHAVAEGIVIAVVAHGEAGRLE